MKKMVLYLVISMGIILLSSGCGPSYNVKVSSIGEAMNNQRSYILFAGNEGESINDLQFKEYANYVHRALKAKGFVKADKNADISIMLSYGIGEPQRGNYTYSMPTYGQTGVSSSNTYGTINSYGNTATYSGTTTYTPTYGVTGSQTYSGTNVTYHRYITLEAVDLKQYGKTQEIVKLWKTTINSTGSSGDLRSAFPVMLGAANEYIGIDTSTEVRVSIQETDERVLKVKGIEKK